MKLLFLNHNVIQNGTYFRAFQFGRHLVERGHDVTVVTTSQRGRRVVRRHEDSGVQIVEMPDLFSGRARTGWDPWNTFRRCVLVRGEPFDLVHAFDSRPAVIIPAIAMRRSASIPLLMDWADWWGRGGTIQDRSGPLMRHTFGRLEEWFEEAFRVQADGSTVISSALERRAIALGVNPESVIRLPGGCLPPHATMERSEARARLGLSGNIRALLHLGVAVQKDADFLFDAFRIAYARDNCLRLLLVGNFRPATPRDLEGAVIRAAGDASLEQIRTWVAASDACVIPLRDTIANRGRWPSKVNMYLSGGRRVLVTDVGDVPEWIRSHQVGLVAAATVPALADGIDALLHEEDARKAAAEDSARSLAENGLSWRVQAERLESFMARQLSLSGAAQ